MTSEIQEIFLEPSPDGNTFQITSSDVKIRTSDVAGNLRDSCKVKSNNIVDYGWETTFYPGHLVSVHMDGMLVAYILRSTQGSNIRVYKRSTECRGLIRASSDAVIDIVWLFSRQPLLLGVFDDGANLFIYEVTDTGKDLNTQLWFSVRRSTTLTEKHDYYRLICCPYVSDRGKGSVDEDLTGLVAVAHGNHVDVLFTHELKRQFGTSADFSELDHGYCVIHEESPVTYITLSPDSTALAVSLESGEVKFYILENIQEIMCVQNWTPHEGNFVTCIMFLDAPIHAPPNIQFWKFALTAGDKNRELKLWSCETWKCFGTLSIEPPSGQMQKNFMTLALDWTANFLFLSDVERKSLYVVEIEQNSHMARFVSFSEFPLVLPALSLAVINVERKSFRPFSPNYSEYYESGEESSDESRNISGICAVLCAVNRKSLLELEIRFQTVPPVLRHDSKECVHPFELDVFHNEMQEVSGEVAQPPLASELAKVMKPPYDFNFNKNSSRTESDQGLAQHDGSENFAKNEPNSEQHSEKYSPSSEEVSNILTGVAGLSCDNHEQPALLEDLPESDIPHSSERYAAPETITEEAFGGEASPHLQLDQQRIAAVLQVLPDTLAMIKEEIMNMHSRLEHQEQLLQTLDEAIVSQQAVLHSVSQTLCINRNQEKELLEKLLTKLDSLTSDSVAHSVFLGLKETVRDTVNSATRNEIVHSLVPQVTEIIRPIKENFQAEVSHKLTATDAAIRESLSRLLKSKSVLESIGQAASQAIASDSHAAFREAFQKSLIPSFDSASHKLFGQLNSIFEEGTKEYIDQMKRNCSAVMKTMSEMKAEFATEFSDERLQAAFSASTAELTQSVKSSFKSELQQQLSGIFSEALLSLKDLIKEEIKRAVENAQQYALEDIGVAALKPVGAISSRSREAIVQQQLNPLLEQSMFNEACSVALSFKDLPLVLYVCSKIDPSKLFADTQRPLQQPVILSLIQQLSCELGAETDLKLSYIQEALTSFDVQSTDVSPEFSTSVLSELRRRLTDFVAGCPPVELQRKARMILMASKSLLITTSE